LHGRGELPAQVGRVLDAGIHALTARRGVDVGGVASKQDAAQAVPGHLALIAVEPRHPPRIVHAVVGAERRADNVADFAEADRRVLGHLVVLAPGDDPVQAVAEGHDQGEGIAC